MNLEEAEKTDVVDGEAILTGDYQIQNTFSMDETALLYRLIIPNHTYLVHRADKRQAGKDGMRCVSYQDPPVDIRTHCSYSFSGHDFPYWSGNTVYKSPPNITSIFQPLSQEVINAFWSHYKSNYRG